MVPGLSYYTPVNSDRKFYLALHARVPDTKTSRPRPAEIRMAQRTPNTFFKSILSFNPLNPTDPELRNLRCEDEKHQVCSVWASFSPGYCYGGCLTGKLAVLAKKGVSV
jgi:hypothetical protein